MSPKIEQHRMPSTNASAEVDVRVLAAGPADEPLPLVLLLHGAMSSAQSLDLHAPLIHQLWVTGALPPCVVACASTPTEGGFYLDWPEGSRWGSVVGDELPDFVSRLRPIDRSRLAVVGASMGGFGALKLAFGNPDRYVAAAALAPAVFPGSTTSDVPERNRQAVLGELLAALDLLPGERVHERLLANLDAIRQRGMALFLGVGERDEFGLRDGSEHLHAQLLAADVSHQYLVVAGGGHMDAGMAELQRAGLTFVGQALLQPAAESDVAGGAP